MRRRFHRLRRASVMLLLLALVSLPFVRIHGESAFRFDISTLRLLFFGTSIWMADFFIILIAVIFLTFLTLFATTLFGRIWCGWLCPQTVLVDATMFVEIIRLNKGNAKIIASWIAGILVSAVVTSGLIGYFVSPYDIPQVLRNGGMHAQILIVSFAVLVALIVLDVIVLRRGFCATVCPYAKMQGVLFDDRTLVVAFDAERADECMNCGACVKVCPVNVDIRKGPHMACIHCAECVDACTERTAARGRTSLVSYTFGIAAHRGTGVRINVLLTGVLTVISLVFLVYLAASRMPFDVNVLLNYTEAPIAGEGSMTRSYMLSLRNMAATDLVLDLNVAAPFGEVRVFPDRITLPKNVFVSKTPILITVAKPSVPTQDPITATLTVRSSQLNKSVIRTIYVMMPKNN